MTCTGFAFLFVMLTCEAPPQPTAVVCPPMRTWSRDFQKKVAHELRAQPGSAMAKVVIDAIGDRDIARACAAASNRKSK